MDKFIINLDKENTKPLYVQIFQQIKDYILEGLLEDKEKLPSIRRLAEELQVNNVTVVQGYKLLEQEGYIITNRGRGTFVSSKRKNFEESYENNNSKLMDKIKWNFADSSPHPETFQVEEFKKIINEVIDRDGGEIFTYQAREGYYPLREAIGKYLNTSSIKNPMEEIHIISGAQQGIDIVSKGLLELDDVVIIESPSYPGARKAFEARGARIVEIPMEEDGMNMKALEIALRKYRPGFIYVMPNFHNPIGISYSREKKKTLLHLAHSHGSIIIEDDYLSDFNFGYKKQLPLKSLDTMEDVIYIKSFSKIFMPGFRLGFLVAPKKYEKRISEAKESADLFTMGLVQRSFDLILRRGFWRSQIQLMEKYYQKGFHLTIEGLKKYMPKEITYEIPEGTLYFWLKLPPGYHSKALYYEGIKRGIVITPGDEFFLEDKNSPYFRITYASMKHQDIIAGLKELGQFIKRFLEDYKSKDLEHNSLSYY